MTKRWIGLVPCASIIFVLATSCGGSDSGGAGGGGTSGIGGMAGGSEGGKSGASEGGLAGASEGGLAGTGQSAGAAGEPETSAGAGGNAGAGVIGSGGTGADAGAAGSPPAPQITPLSPAAIADLAFWMDGNAPSYSDLDENYLTPADSGRIRSIAEAPPLTGHWKAPTSAERPIRELGALNLKPIETSTGYYLQDTAGTIHTDNSTIAISFKPLSGAGGPAQGGLSGQIGDSSQTQGIFIIGNAIGLYFNHTSVFLTRRLARAAHMTIIVRFTPTGADVQYDIDGLHASESVTATIGHETASNFTLGFDPGNSAGMYGFVSQAVGVDRALSDTEATGLMKWLTAQPIPAAFPVTEPLVAILGDSIANGDQTPNWQSWAFRMLANLLDTHPDVQLLNAATNGSGIPKVKGSDYSDVVLPWYSANRAKNILVIASGSNDLAGGNNLQDLLDRYYGLLDSAKATGWRTVACTVLPRSDAGLALGLAGFESERKAFNADIVAHWADHAAALADVAAISGMGAAGDSDNTAYYSVDKVHPLAPGHALLEPVYRAAVAGLLAP